MEVSLSMAPVGVEGKMEVKGGLLLVCWMLMCNASNIIKYDRTISRLAS